MNNRIECEDCPFVDFCLRDDRSNDDCTLGEEVVLELILDIDEEEFLYDEDGELNLWHEMSYNKYNDKELEDSDWEKYEKQDHWQQYLDDEKSFIDGTILDVNISKEEQKEKEYDYCNN